MKSHEELWKISSPKFSNKELRAAALNTAANMIREYVPQVTNLEILKRVTSLKTQFSREREKLAESAKSKAGVADLHTSSWWPYEKLLFLTEDAVNEISCSNTHAAPLQNVSKQLLFQNLHMISGERCLKFWLYQRTAL